MNAFDRTLLARVLPPTLAFVGLATVLAPLAGATAWAVVSWLALSAVLVALTWFVARRALHSSISRLMETVDAARAGLPLPHAELTGDDDLARLDRALRRAFMECGLAAHQLGETHRGIEERVAERTAELEALRDRALEASRAKSEFLANMSHEIRTPMNGVLGMAEILARTSLNSEQRQFLDTIQRSGESLLGVINDILDYSKIESGRIVLEALDFDLHAALHDVADLLGESASRKGIELLCDIAPQVPRYVVGDSARLRQVLVNLVGNAIKFTEQGTVQLRVRARDPGAAERERDVLEFQVYDTGVGIASEALETIFDSFSQADSSTTRRFGGTGLGLTISQNFVRLMGGELRVESELGSWSNFTFALDFARSPHTDDSMKELVARLVGQRVLVVDDVESNRCILQRQLSDAGLMVTCVEGGAEALEIARRARDREQPFDFGILDYQMPGMSGVQLAEQLQPLIDGEVTRLALLSSVCAPEGLREGLFACTFLKPARHRQLLTGLAGLIGGPQARLEAAARSATSRPGELGADDPPVAFSGDVLVVEDNPVNQLVARKLLTRLGFDVEVADDGAAALARVTARPFDLIFMDCQMPIMDGYEATAAIRLVRPEQTVIAMTANAMAGDRTRCLEAGMDDYLSKPIVVSELRRVVERHTLPTVDGS